MFLVWVILPLIFSFPFAYFVTRLIIVILEVQKKRRSNRYSLKRKKSRIKTLIVVGSGGHTSEILRLVSSLSDCYTPRHYVVASTDKMSQDKIRTLEESRKTNGHSKAYETSLVPRSREVKQSYLSSIFTTLYATCYAFPLVITSQPDLVLCNGPGTCIPLCAAAFLLKVMWTPRLQIVYVESICRVETLSLSARILYPIVDHMLVQWPELQEKYPMCKYLGRLV